VHFKDSSDGDFIILKNRIQFFTHKVIETFGCTHIYIYAQASLAWCLAQGTSIRHEQGRVESSRPKGSKGADLKIEQLGHDIEESLVPFA